MLVICKDCSLNANPIEIAQQFTIADPMVVAVAAVPKNSGHITAKFIWRHHGKKVIEQVREYQPDPLAESHRIAAFLKMPFFEYKEQKLTYIQIT